jgi:hypothetical protein
VTGAAGALAGAGWELPGAVDAGADGEGDAVDPQAVASRTLAIANPMNLVRIDELLHVS